MKTIEAAKRVVANSQAEEIDGVLLDLFTASAISQVYDALSERNQARYAAMGVEKAAAIAFAALEKAR